MPRRVSSAHSLVLVTSLAISVHGIAAAHADECRIDENCTLSVESLDFSGSWEWQAEASVDLAARMDSDRQRENEATSRVGAELAYEGRTCRWFGVGGDIGGYWDGSDVALTGRQDLTFCLPYPVFRPETRFSLHQDLRPSLAAAPTVRAARVRGGEISMLIKTLHLSATKGEVTTHMNFLVMGGGFELVAQDVADMPARTDSIHFIFDIVHGYEYGEGFLGTDRELRIVGVEGEAMSNPDDQNPDNALDVFATDILFFQALSARLGRATGLYSDMTLGMSVGTVADVQVISPRVGFSIMGGQPDRSYGVGYKRSLSGTNYSAILMEDRISGWWRMADDRNATTIHGFVALTDLVDPVGERDLTLTGGIGMNRDMRVGDYLLLALSAEVARSYYATLHGVAPLDPAWVAQIGVSASASKSSR